MTATAWANSAPAGVPINPALVTGLSGPQGIAISGTNVFVANNGNGTIGEYTTSGATNNAHLISGLSTPAGLAIKGSNLFVAEYGRNRVGEYTLSGAIVNTNLITVFEPNGLAVSDNFLFVAGSSGEVGEYTIAGATNDPSLFLLPSAFPFGIIVLPGIGLAGSTTPAEALTKTNVICSWSTNGFAYQLQTSLMLAAGSWTVVTNTPVITYGNYGISLGTTNPAQFFRLQSIN
jgi:hypothetical protein